MAAIKISVNLIAHSGEEVLLIKRKSTKFYDGWYALVAGHVEPQETMIQAMLRELQEEIGVSHLTDSDLTLVSLLSRVYDGLTYHDVIFAAPLAAHTPLVLEAEKVAEARWVKFHALPVNTIPYIQDTVQRFIANRQSASVHSYVMVGDQLLLKTA